MVYVAGQANPQFGAVDKQLSEFQTAVQGAAKGSRVSIVEQRSAPGGGGVVEFRISMDLVREGAAQ